jgi:hypothetical protein
MIRPVAIVLQALALAALSLVVATTSAQAGARAAVFEFDLIDDSQEGEADGVRADQTKRLVMISEELVKAIKADGRYEPVDLTPIAADIERLRPIYKCNQCEDDLARKVNADFLFIGTVQKVSNLILNLNLYVRDVKAGKIIQVMSSDIRSNTDESWLRGVRYVIKNQLFAEKRPGQE